MFNVGVTCLRIQRHSTLHFLFARNASTTTAKIAPTDNHGFSETINTQAREEICGNIAELKVAELNKLMRGCGLTQGTVKADKIESLGMFIWDAQKLALSRYKDKNKSKRIPRSPAKIHASFVPDEVVSIDIGYKNLAFAHVSRTGEVLGWRRAELLKEATFEPWTLARVVEEYVQSTLPMISASKCTYIVEHQRFRSQGSAAVTNSIMVNNLVEALLYANLRHIGARIQTVSPNLVSTECEPRIPEMEPDSAANDPAQPRAKNSSVKPEKKTRGRGVSDKKLQKENIANIIVQMDSVLREQKQLTRTRHGLILSALGRPLPRIHAPVKAASRGFDELMQKEKASLDTMRDLRRRLIKKERTIAVVQAWILSSLTSQKMLSKQVLDVATRADLATNKLLSDEESISAWPFISGKHVAFAQAAAEMFCDEAKKDDLCDCLTQAVAWYRWQQNTVGVLDRYGSDLITKSR